MNLAQSMSIPYTLIAARQHVADGPVAARHVLDLAEGQALVAPDRPLGVRKELELAAPGRGGHGQRHRAPDGLAVDLEVEAVQIEEVGQLAVVEADIAHGLGLD